MSQGTPIRSLKDMYIHDGFLDEEKFPASEGFLCENQRRFFCKKATEILASERDTIEADLIYCLGQVWHSHDMGGISSKRSVQSWLLESAQEFIRQGDLGKTKECIAILLAMHHDINYMNKHRWMDYTITSPMDAASSELIPLVMAGLILDIDQLPNITNISNDDILKVC